VSGRARTTLLSLTAEADAICHSAVVQEYARDGRVDCRFEWEVEELWPDIKQDCPGDRYYRSFRAGGLRLKRR
jgi:hypothetical protein